MDATATSLVTLRHFRDLPDAFLAKGKLEFSGIECALADANLVRMDWLWSNVIGGLRLQVREEDYATALAVLNEPPPVEFTEEEVGENYVQPHCPRCDSLDIGFETIDRFWSYGLWLVLPFPVPVRKHNWKCYACLAEWVEESSSTNSPPLKH